MPNLSEYTAKGLSRLFKIVIVFLVIVILAGVAYYTLQGNKSENIPILYSADAYTDLASSLESSFSSSTGIRMAPPKSGGSLTLGQEISQGNPASVFLSVSKTAVSQAVLGEAFDGWAIAFASDQMALTYSNATSQNSAGLAEINSYVTAQEANTTTAWFNFFSNLTSGAVKVGISDPSSDPAGYRGWLVLEAAGYLYDSKNSSYFADRMLASHANITSSSAADLVSPLEEGNIQFLFIYKSAGLADKLGVMVLPAQVNFGNESYASFYSKFSYQTSSGIQTGGVVSLFVTVLKNAIDYSDSMSFVMYVIKNCSNVVTSYGLSPLSPAQLFNDSAVPLEIQQLLNQGYLVKGGSL